ncbi:hypothetical protein L596_004477 [Steinernema carpocapsae]|uniref:EGF-like domain-containing protein n=1 Tax=Steinernema carpocapsae TaxID=34508 RepID=A0A4U8UX09_STECR|nr:hypothetical protein L596_004477 [Steinernema carpocapsae]
MNSKVAIFLACALVALLIDNGDGQNTAANFDPNAPCTEADCNNRGACLGVRANPLCFCRHPYTNPRCEDEFCESTRDCNGRGICIGNKSTVTCMCSANYSGKSCEIVGNSAGNATKH